MKKYYKSFWLLVILILAYSGFANAQNVCGAQSDECQKAEPVPVRCQYKWQIVPDSYIQSIILKRQTELDHTSNQVDFLIQKTQDLEEVIKAEQMILLFDKFLFTEKMMLETIQRMNLRFHPLLAEEIVSLIELFEDPENKFEVFKIVVQRLMDVSSKGKNLILNSLPNCYHKEAENILEPIKEFNCLFGTLKGNIIAFVISPHKSMAGPLEKDSEITRLDYIKAQLKDTMRKQLKPGMKFNIIESNAGHHKKWNVNYTEVTQRTLKSAFQFIDEDIKIDSVDDLNLLHTGILLALKSDNQPTTVCLVSRQFPWRYNCPHCDAYIHWLRTIDRLPYHLNKYSFF